MLPFTELFDTIWFTHLMHLATQTKTCYAMKNAHSYIHSDIVGFINLLEACKSLDPQPANVRAFSSSVYGLNTKLPFSKEEHTDRLASLYAATKKANEEISHNFNYNYIHRILFTGLRFFTVRAWAMGETKLIIL